MTETRKIRRLRLLLLLTFTSLTATYAQQGKVIELEGADRMEGKILDGEQVRELVGNVKFRQGSVVVNSDTAIQFLESRRIALRGNLVVRDDAITMRGKRGMYHSSDRYAEAFENVRLNDGVTTLTAEYGRYYTEEKKAFFRDNVVVRDSSSMLKADELTYYREDKRSIADGRVEIRNVEDNITIFGDHFENYPRQNFSKMTDRPRVVQIDTLEGRIDTFIVSSRVMESYRDSVRRLVAIDSVRMTSSELAGESGQAVYLTELDSIIMRKKPVIWYEESQVSGDSVFIRLKKRRPETVYIRGDAFAISRSDSLYTDRFDQLTGESITMFFADGRVRRIEVDRTATSVYCLYEQRKDTVGSMRRPNGINKTTGDHVVIYFLNGSADRISVGGGVQGEYFPEKMVEGRESDYYLPGFNWREDRPALLRRNPVRKNTVAGPSSGKEENLTR